MTQRIIEEYEARTAAHRAIHAVTMQNHTTYDASRYAADELVKITEHPGLSTQTLSQLQDFATGVCEADAALGALVDYFRNVDEPTIIVFWGDHFNPVGKGYELFEKTGYIEKGDTGSPDLHRNGLDDLEQLRRRFHRPGTIAAYDISPAMMDPGWPGKAAAVRVSG